MHLSPQNYTVEREVTVIQEMLHSTNVWIVINNLLFKKSFIRQINAFSTQTYTIYICKLNIQNIYIQIQCKLNIPDLNCIRKWKTCHTSSTDPLMEWPDDWDMSNTNNFLAIPSEFSHGSLLPKVKFSSATNWRIMITNAWMSSHTTLMLNTGHRLSLNYSE